MKTTRTGTKWAHVSCALWIPEVRNHLNLGAFTPGCPTSHYVQTDRYLSWKCFLLTYISEISVLPQIFLDTSVRFSPKLCICEWYFQWCLINLFERRDIKDQSVGDGDGIAVRSSQCSYRGSEFSSITMSSSSQLTAFNSVSQGIDDLWSPEVPVDIYTYSNIFINKYF